MIGVCGQHGSVECAWEDSISRYAQKNDFSWRRKRKLKWHVWFKSDEYYKFSLNESWSSIDWKFHFVDQQELEAAQRFLEQAAQTNLVSFFEWWVIDLSIGLGLRARVQVFSSSSVIRSIIVLSDQTCWFSFYWLFPFP